MADQPERFDLVVIGGGPGGYVAAARAAQLGMRVACLDRDERLGGVCLNRGCIPSKALLESSAHYERAAQGLALHGVDTGRATLDLAAMLARKDKVVADLTANVRRLLERHKVQIVRGQARLAAADRVALSTPEGTLRELTAGAIVLATGSDPVSPPGIACDGQNIVTSTEALAFDRVPPRLGIVGAGYIGLELGSVWRRLGSQVTVIEMLPRIAPGMEGQSARTLERLLRAQGLDIRLSTRVTTAQMADNQVRLTLETQGQAQELSVDRLLVCVGRRPATRDLGLEAAGVRTAPDTGRVLVNARWQTSVPTIYAIGDLVAGPMLAHKASAEGAALAQHLAGRHGEVNYDAIPAVIYTWPEAAGVGLTSETLKERGIPHRSGTFPFGGNARARCAGEAEGFVKVLAHARTDRVLGVHILGPHASELIAAGGLAMELGASAEDIARTVFSHPTLSEALMEAAALASG
jgi:dihydrolipoamide dehydrogenase